MSYDRVSLASGGFAGQLPQRSTVAPGGDSGLGLASVSAVSRGLQYGTAPLTTGSEVVRKWGDNFSTWSTRSAFADMLDNVIYYDKNGFRLRTPGWVSGSSTGPDTPGAGNNARSLSGPAGAVTAVGTGWSYSNLLNLGEKTLRPGEFLSGWRETAANNTRPFLTRLSNAWRGEGSFFRPGVTAGNVFKNTVIGENIKPIRELFTTGGEKKIGSALGRMAGFGLMAYGILEETKAAYRQAKAQEDGSFGSKLRTWGTTAKAFLTKTAKSAISWEIGGIGFAIGKAVLPLALGPLSIGGILVGALAGALAYTAMEKISPSYKGQEPEPEDTGQHAGNPFASASV